MKNRNVKVIDDHNIDRNANVMFAMDLEGSEYVVYWIERDENSNNVFVSKVLKNIDGTYNMINIDDDDKKRDVSDTVKMLISNAVSDQNDKLVGTSVALSNGKAVKFIDVSFNKEQNINVSKTYITTVKKEVTKVSEDYYDVVIEETKVADVLPSVTPVVETVAEVFPELGTVTAPVVETVQSVPEPTPAVLQQEVIPTPVVGAAPVVEPVVSQPVMETIPQEVIPQPVVIPTPAVETPTVAPVQAPIISTPVVEPVQAAVVETPVVMPQPAVVQTPVEASPVVQPVVESIPQPSIIEPTPVVAAPVVPESTTLVFDGAKETNLNAALGEVANSSAIPVENIEPVREFGVDTPVPTPVVTEPAAVPQQPIIAPMVQPENNQIPKTLTKKAGFANSKFFMVVAIAFFLASCIFLGYEVYRYFQLTK